MPDPPNKSVTPDRLVWAYRHGAFPMAHSANGPVKWYIPEPRAILPLERFRVRRSLQRRVRQRRFHITYDRAFEQVIRACAQPRLHTSETWINQEIIEAYLQLHTFGLAHSVEAWSSASDVNPDNTTCPVGGLYGVAIGGVFFGESMFYRVTDASKVCLVHLVNLLRQAGFILLDVQFSSRHLEQFGVEEVSHTRYMQLLGAAIERPVKWNPNELASDLAVQTYATNRL